MDKKRKSSEKEEEEAEDAMNTDGGFEDANETPTEGTDGTGTSDTASLSPSTIPSSAAAMNSDFNTTMMKLMLEQKATGVERDQATRVWQFNSDKAAFDNKVAMGGLIQGLSVEIATVAKEVGGIKTQVSALDVRMTAMENGTTQPPKNKSAGKGKPPVMRVDMSPRGADPFDAAG